MNRKTLGWIVLIISVMFLDFSVGPSDFVTLKAYEMYSGVDVSFDNLSEIYLDYTIWSFIVGAILFVIAMFILGWTFKKLFRKLDIGKYKVALFIGALVVVLIAYLDIRGLIFFTDLGRDYLTGDFPESYWIAFRNTAYILMGLVALCYYNFAHKDKSETAAVFLTPFILFWFGLSDILFFILQRVNIPQTLPWLDNHLIIGWISSNLGFETVTNLSLLISAFIGIILVLIMTKFMKERL